MPDAPDNKTHAHRRGADGRMEVGPAWETLIERQIREALTDGQFENLPYQGQPLPNDDNPCAGDRALACRMLKGAGVAPPWIQPDKELRELLARRDAIPARAGTDPAPSAFARRRDRAALQDLVIEIKAGIARVNAEAPTDRQRRRPLSVEAELARFDEACRR